MWKLELQACQCNHCDANDQVEEDTSIIDWIQQIQRITCRQEHLPRTIHEIVAVSKIKKKEIGRWFKRILKENYASVEPTTVEDYMPRFCDALSLDLHVKEAAATIAKRAEELDIGKSESDLTILNISVQWEEEARPLWQLLPSTLPPGI